MQLGERKSSKNQVQMDAPYLLNHKASSVLEEDMVIVVKTMSECFPKRNITFNSIQFK